MRASDAGSGWLRLDSGFVLRELRSSSGLAELLRLVQQPSGLSAVSQLFSVSINVCLTHTASGLRPTTAA